MKPTILTRMAGVAAALALPGLILAQDLTPDPSGTGQSSGSLPPAPGVDAQSSAGTFQEQSGQQEAPVSSGIIVEDGSAYVIHKLQNEMSMPDGSKISPTGTITKSDGSVQQMEKGKMLTLDGRIMEAPFADEGQQRKGGDTHGGSSVTSPDKPRMPGSSEPGATHESTPQPPQSGVGVPKSGSPFSSPSAPSEPSPSSSPDPSTDANLDSPQTPPDASAEQLTPQYTD